MLALLSPQAMNRHPGIVPYLNIYPPHLSAFRAEDQCVGINAKSIPLTALQNRQGKDGKEEHRSCCQMGNLIFHIGLLGFSSEDSTSDSVAKPNTSIASISLNSATNASWSASEITQNICSL
ncbi:MAG: hypothetical protein U0176_03745 [Bacteroidia bacterium]